MSDGRTLLYIAAQNGHHDIVKALLGRGDIAINKSANDGRIALSIAAENGHLEVFEYLLSKSKDPPLFFPKK